MKKAVSYLLACFSLMLALHVSADEEKAFAQAYQQYSQAIEKGDGKAALTYAQKAYTLGMDLLDPESESLLAVTDNYAALLIKKGNTKGALKLYVELLTLNERVFGQYGKSLVPILEVIYKLETQLGAKRAQATKKRYYKLLYRHNAAQIAETMAEGNLPTNKEANDVLEDVQKRTGQRFERFESEHWTIFYNGKNKEGVEIFSRQLELAYRSVREFLISASLSVKPLDEKLVAVFFKEESAYMSYLEIKGLNIRGKGSYSERAGLMLFRDVEGKRSDWNFFKQANFIAKEVLQQVAVAANVFSSDRGYYPLWLYDGLAYSFEFNEIDKPFGPHTKNLSASNWSRAQDLIDSGGWLSIRELVRLSNLEEKDKANKEVLYIMGTYLVRFLYEERGDEFNEYLLLLPQQNRDAQKSMYREKSFKKAFGDPEKLEKDWRRFLNSYGISLN